MTWYARCSICCAMQRLDTKPPKPENVVTCCNKVREVFEDKGAGWPGATELVVLRNLAAMLENVERSRHEGWVLKLASQPRLFPDDIHGAAYARVAARVRAGEWASRAVELEIDQLRKAAPR